MGGWQQQWWRGGVWNGNKGRQTEKPEPSRGWSCTYLEVCDLIKAKLVYANKSKALVIWNYYTHIHTFPLYEEHLLVLQNYPKWKEKSNEYCNEKSYGGCGHSSGRLTPKQTSPGLLNNYSARRESLKASSNRGKKRWSEYDITTTVSINQSGAEKGRKRTSLIGV